MNKRYLPVIAAVLIVAVAFAAFMPVFAQIPLVLTSTPTLTVVTIAQDDQLRKTGVMWFGITETDYVDMQTGVTPISSVQDLMSQFKILVSYNGVPVTPASLACQVVEKDKYEPKTPQGTWETLASAAIDASAWFICKPRWGKPGVGVLDVYYIGPQNAFHFADYILNVQVTYAIGRSTVYGAEMQDICVLGWPSIVVPGATITTAGSAGPAFIGALPDPLYGYKSCEDAALAEMNAVNVPISWGTP